MSNTTMGDAESGGFIQSLRQPKALIALILLMWVPLVTYVMFGEALLGDNRDLLLLPAIPATALLYAVALVSWWESKVAVIGLTLVFFWLFIAVTVPFLPLLDPNKPIAPFTLPFSEKKDIFF